MEATSPVEKTSPLVIKDANPKKHVDHLKLATPPNETKRSSEKKFILSQEKLLKLPVVSFNTINKQLNDGQIEVAVVPTDGKTENVVPSQYFRNEEQVKDAIVGAYASAGKMTLDVPQNVYQLQLDADQQPENQAGDTIYGIFEPVIGNENTNPRYRAIALLVVRRVNLDAPRPEDADLPSAESTTANAYLSPEDVIEQMISTNRKGLEDRKPEDILTADEQRDKDWDTAHEIFTRKRTINRPKFPAFSEATVEPAREPEAKIDQLQIGEMNEQDILSKLTVGQLEVLVDTGELDNNARAYLATVIWEKYHRIGKAIQHEIEDEVGNSDDYRAIDILFSSHQEGLNELKALSQGRENFFEKANFWGLTEAVVKRVLPNLGDMTAISKVLELIRPIEKTLLKFALLDEVNALISARLVGMMDRDLSDDEIVELLQTDSAGLNAFLNNFGKKPSGLQSLWASIRGQSFHEQQGTAKEFAQDLMKSIRKSFMPTLETQDNPTTVTIEGPQVPTETEVDQNFTKNQEQAVNVVNELLLKYGNTFEIRKQEKVALAKQVLAHLKDLIYKPGSEGDNMIQYADKQLKPLGLETRFRPQPKQPKEQPLEPRSIDDLYKDWLA